MENEIKKSNKDKHEDSGILHVLHDDKKVSDVHDEYDDRTDNKVIEVHARDPKPPDPPLNNIDSLILDLPSLKLWYTLTDFAFSCWEIVPGMLHTN